MCRIGEKPAWILDGGDGLGSLAKGAPTMSIDHYHAVIQQLDGAQDRLRRSDTVESCLRSQR